MPTADRRCVRIFRLMEKCFVQKVGTSIYYVEINM